MDSKLEQLALFLLHIVAVISVEQEYKSYTIISHPEKEASIVFNGTNVFFGYDDDGTVVDVFRRTSTDTTPTGSSEDNFISIIATEEKKKRTLLRRQKRRETCFGINCDDDMFNGGNFWDSVYNGLDENFWDDPFGYPSFHPDPNPDPMPDCPNECCLPHCHGPGGDMIRCCWCSTCGDSCPGCD